MFLSYVRDLKGKQGLTCIACNEPVPHLHVGVYSEVQCKTYIREVFSKIGIKRPNGNIAEKLKSAKEKTNNCPYF